MGTVITIEGMFRVAKCTKNEYGVQATIVEMDEVYPQSFSLSLPEGHMWERGQACKLTLITHPRTISAKVGGNKFTTYEVTDYKMVKMTVKYAEEKGSP